VSDLKQEAMDRVGEVTDYREYGDGSVSYTFRSNNIPVPGFVLPESATARNEYPMFDGLLAYFPAALAWVSKCSKVGNDQHNPGQPMHWAMDKSTDHGNKILRHLMESGTDDSDGIPHSVKVAWRALALAQEDLMARKGYGMPRNAVRSNPIRQNDEE
jgi:hypothetical protein